jgi:uncharacterized membrane protein
MNLKSQNHIGIFLLVLVLASILRFYGLDRLSLWADELWVVVASITGSLPDMIKAVYYHDNHPPGHYLLVRYTQLLIGTSDFAIRLPSAIAGIALVAATFVTGKKALSAKAGLIAATLVAGSYQAIYYSQEARPNIFVALFALLAFHYFRLVVLERDRVFKNYFLFWLSALLCSYFHYAGLVFCFCLGLIALTVIVLTRNKADLVAATKLFVPVALLYLPWLFGTLRHLVATPITGWQRPPDVNTLKTTFNFLFGPDDVRVIFYLLVFTATVMLAAWLAGQLLLAKKSRAAVAAEHIFISCILAMVVLPVVVFYIKSIFSQDAYNHRHFLYAIPLMALLTGFYFDLLTRKFSTPGQSRIFIATLSLLVLYQLAANNGRALYTANHFKQEFRETAQVVANDLTRIQSPGKNDVLIVSNTVFFDHYLNRFTKTQRKSDFIYEWDKKITALSALITSRHISEFYYLEAPIIPGANNMITAEDIALMDNYQPLCRTRFKRAQVFKFAVNTKQPGTAVSDLPDCRKN